MYMQSRWWEGWWTSRKSKTHNREWKTRPAVGRARPYQFLSAWFWCSRRCNIPCIFTTQKRWASFILIIVSKLQGWNGRHFHGRAGRHLASLRRLSIMHRLVESSKRDPPTPLNALSASTQLGWIVSRTSQKAWI